MAARHNQHGLRHANIVHKTVHRKEQTHQREIIHGVRYAACIDADKRHNHDDRHGINRSKQCIIREFEFPVCTFQSILFPQRNYIAKGRRKSAGEYRKNARHAGDNH